MGILYLFDFIVFFVNIDCAYNAIGNGSVPIKGKRAIFIAGFVLTKRQKICIKR